MAAASAPSYWQFVQHSINCFAIKHAPSKQAGTDVKGANEVAIEYWFGVPPTHARWGTVLREFAECRLVGEYRPAPPAAAKFAESSWVFRLYEYWDCRVDDSDVRRRLQYWANFLDPSQKRAAGIIGTNAALLRAHNLSEGCRRTKQVAHVHFPYKDMHCIVRLDHSMTEGCTVMVFVRKSNPNYGRSIQFGASPWIGRGFHWKQCGSEEARLIAYTLDDSWIFCARDPKGFYGMNELICAAGALADRLEVKLA